MEKEEIKIYLNGLNEVDLLDFYNTIACEYGSNDDMIHLNNKSFFESQFVNEKDSEQSKINPRSKYNQKDKFIRMIEYKKIETSSSLKSLIEFEVLTSLVYDYFDEVVNMGLLD